MWRRKRDKDLRRVLEARARQDLVWQGDLARRVDRTLERSEEERRAEEQRVKEVEREQLEEKRRKAEEKKKEDKKRREVEKQKLEEERCRKRRKEVDAATRHIIWFLLSLGFRSQ